MANSEKSKIFTENGISIEVKEHHDKPGKCKAFYNPVMQICREFVLVALGAFLQSQDSDKQIRCLDAFAASGIGGLQWKKHHGDKISVTVNELDPEVCSTINENCTKNNFKCGSLEASESNADVLELTNLDANVILHQRQHHFIHLDPYGSTVQFLDSAFRNVYHKGMVIVTATDVASLFGKTSNVTLRNYAAYSVKTDYTKELAARILLAAVARAASRCNKGIQVVYTVAVEHFVQVGVLINRGATHADANISRLRRILHCQMCEEWALYPDTRAPVEEPYKLLDCDCHAQNPGKTAVELGPLWSGELYDSKFILQMAAEDSRLSLSTRLQNLLELMYCESLCSKNATDLTAFKTFAKSVHNISENISSKKSDSKNVNLKPEDCDSEDTVKRHSEPVAKKAKLMNKTENSASLDDGKSDNQEMPMFYYDVHRRKFKDVGQLPKMSRLVAILHSGGYRASRTHFEPQAVRTNATLRQLTSVIEAKCSNNK